MLGNGLVARLLYAALEAGVCVHREVSTKRLLVENGRVAGLEVAASGDTKTVRVRHGVVLAGGGFLADPEGLARELPSPTPRYTPNSAVLIGSGKHGSSSRTLR